MRLQQRLAIVAIAAAGWATLASFASAQAPAPQSGEPAPPAVPPARKPDRFRLVLNACFWPQTLSFSDSRTLTEFAEQTTISTSYEVATGFGPDFAVQVSLYRRLGLLVGYSYVSRDQTGHIDVSRPHPLYLNRPRTASEDVSGGSYTEGAVSIDVAYARTAGHLEWVLFAGLTLFQVQADLLEDPVYNETYPYDELTIREVPGRTVKDSPAGFNVGGRLDYRFGSSRRFGAGVQLRYSKATVNLQATPDATAASFDAGGVQVAGGLRIYF